MSAHRRAGANALAWLSERRKAIVAFVLPGLVLLAPTLLSGGLPSAADWRIAAATCLLTAVGVERVGNASKRQD